MISVFLFGGQGGKEAPHTNQAPTLKSTSGHTPYISDFVATFGNFGKVL